MTIGEKIRNLRESKKMLQRELAALLNIGEGYLSKIEHNQKQIKRSDLIIISEIFNTSIFELETLWLANKIYEVVIKENSGLEALKVAEKQVKYKKRNE